MQRSLQFATLKVGVPRTLPNCATSISVAIVVAHLSEKSVVTLTIVRSTERKRIATENCQTDAKDNRLLVWITKGSSDDEPARSATA